MFNQRYLDSLHLDDVVDSIIIGGEKWVWVTGYKGTDKDMKCHNDFQYELGKTYDMPEDEPIVTCCSGFHMCLKLTDVYDYVGIGNDNRFFEVRALVREWEKDRYGNDNSTRPLSKNNKLAAKSIEFIRELTTDEILAHISESTEWSESIKQTAMIENVAQATKIHRTNVLVKLGYAEPLAKYIVESDNSGYTLAVALDAQPGIGMDTKINAILSHI